MNFKFILQILNDDGTVKSEMQMKTLRDISNTLRIEYHQGRQLYLLNKKAKKLAHPFLIKLAERYKIIDNPAIFEPLDIEL